MIQLNPIAATTRAADTLGFSVLQAIANTYNEKDVAKREWLYTQRALTKEAKSDKIMWIFTS